MNLLPFSPVALLAVLVFLTGCLPGSGRRTSTELFPQDSLSREIAAGMAVDSLSIVREVSGNSEISLRLPHSVQYGPGEYLYAADTRRNSLFQFSESGDFIREISFPEIRFPYLSGARGDTLAVMNRGTDELLLMVENRIARTIDLPGGPYVSTLVTDEGTYYKAAGEDFDSYIARLDETGQPASARGSLTGPFWRQVGFLREWEGEVISLSGYRPVVDLFDGSPQVDSLALVGFDSPMLARSRQFVRGELAQGPLLTSSARPLDSLLFALNLRPGWIRIDVYDRNGRLQYILEQEHQTVDMRLYPLDLDVRRVDENTYEFAVATEQPEARLTILRWNQEDRVVSEAGPERRALTHTSAK